MDKKENKYSNCFEFEDGKLVCNLTNLDEISQIKVLKMISKNTDFSGKITELKFKVDNEKMPKSVITKIAEVSKLLNCETKIVVHHTKSDRHAYSHKDIEWDLQTIIKANSEIDKVCNFIKKNNFSPFEALAYVHFYVSTLAKYNSTREDGKHKWGDYDQFFAGGYMNLPEIVCAGYSALMEEIIDKLKLDGLKCKIISVEFKHLKKNVEDSHARCMIFIKDRKYGLDQTVFDDPTWDNDENLNFKYAHFAMSNDCFKNSNNKMYDFDEPMLGEYDKNRTKIEYFDEACFDKYNNSRNQINQAMIEKVFFTVLKAKYPKDTFDKLWSKLQKMASETF
ncbi:MAG: hypothetical protein J6T39_01505, partial [Clostridia bacterium]|nr:hypothetical protein [Clostridia bacterium]